MSRVGSQQRTLIGILEGLRPYWRRDAALPARIDALLRGDRRLGSRDRRLYRELVFTALRYLPWVESLLIDDPDGAVRRIAWLAADIEPARPFRAEAALGLPPCPADVAGKARILGTDPGRLVPDWFHAECPELDSPGFLDILLSRAPLWIRLNADQPEAVFREFGRLGWSWRESPGVSGAVSLPVDAPVERTESFRLGRIEVQDVGSQFILKCAEAAPGGSWLDACAGAGGKTLQLATLVGPGGHVTAWDSRRAPLAQLKARAARAGVLDRISIADGKGQPGGFDGVLVDAPCSGSGTWRRAPHLKWTTPSESLRRFAEVQVRLLHENLPRVRLGGLLVYSTCSLCSRENEAVVEEFLRTTKAVSDVNRGLRILPTVLDGDGYFVATFRRVGT